MNIKEQSLKDALNFLKLDELPKQYREADAEQWLEAVVLVRKKDTSLSYAIAKRNADGRISYTHDFGHMSPIAGLVSVHPYLSAEPQGFVINESDLQKRERLISELGEDTREQVMAMLPEEIDVALAEIDLDKKAQNEEERRAILSSLEAAPTDETPDLPTSNKPEPAVRGILDGVIGKKAPKKKP